MDGTKRKNRLLLFSSQNLSFPIFFVSFLSVIFFFCPLTMRFNLLLGVAYAYVATTSVSAAVMKEIPSQSVSLAVDTASKSMESMVAKASGSEIPRWSGKT